MGCFSIMAMEKQTINFPIPSCTSTSTYVHVCPHIYIHTYVVDCPVAGSTINPPLVFLILHGHFKFSSSMHAVDVECAIIRIRV